MVISAPATPAESSVSMPVWRFALRLAWVVVRLLLALLLMQRGGTFFYQGF